MTLTDNDFVQFQAALQADAPTFFSSDTSPVFIARAPGRLDVMGGIADYSGSLVAEMPIAQAALVGVQRDDSSEGAVVVRSANAQTEGLQAEVRLPAEVFINPVSLLKTLREGPPEAHWAGYLAGCFAILRAEGLLPRGIGARMYLSSSVPIGAGVASSAAVEVATMRAICAAFDVDIDGLTLARLCQRTENEVMDAPCGIMDQVTCALGEAGHLLLLLCQPHKIQGTVALPVDWSVFGIDSGVKHHVSGAAYTRTRVAAFMGYKILADAAKAGFGGYLCNATPDDLNRILPDGLPETMSGTEFLAKHSGIYDTVTAVETGEVYHVRAATEHPVYENQRVLRFVEALRDGSESAFSAAGAEMVAAHRSYSACGLGTMETDLLVDLAMAQAGVAGAKITGGGSGGTVCVLCKAEVEEAVRLDIATHYREVTGIKPRIITGTSPGAWATEVRRWGKRGD